MEKENNPALEKPKHTRQEIKEEYQLTDEECDLLGIFDPISRFYDAMMPMGTPFCQLNTSDGIDLFYWERRRMSAEEYYKHYNKYMEERAEKYKQNEHV